MDSGAAGEQHGSFASLRMTVWKKDCLEKRLAIGRRSLKNGHPN